MTSTKRIPDFLIPINISWIQVLSHWSTKQKGILWNDSKSTPVEYSERMQHYANKNKFFGSCFFMMNHFYNNNGRDLNWKVGKYDL